VPNIGYIFHGGMDLKIYDDEDLRFAAERRLGHQRTDVPIRDTLRVKSPHTIHPLSV
jgi:hypothetical protein